MGAQASARTAAPIISPDRAEAFEFFRKEHPDHDSIQSNRRRLKELSGHAKALGGEVNQARTTINGLKAAIQKARLQTGVAGLVDGGRGEDLMSPEEAEYRQQLEGEKSQYKSKIAGLKSFKQEIEHLQHLLEMAKVKLHRDFEEWCVDQAGRSGAGTAQAGHHEEFPPHASAAEQRVQKAWGTPPLSPIGKPPYPHTAAAAAPTFAQEPPPVPAAGAVIGTAPVDDDIEAFFKAREAMRNR
jgi:hypothetical protein